MLGAGAGFAVGGDAGISGEEKTGAAIAVGGGWGGVWEQLAINKIAGRPTKDKTRMALKSHAPASFAI